MALFKRSIHPASLARCVVRSEERRRRRQQQQQQQQRRSIIAFVSLSHPMMFISNWSTLREDMVIGASEDRY
jgi:hypothetical protein